MKKKTIFLKYLRNNRQTAHLLHKILSKTTERPLRSRLASELQRRTYLTVLTLILNTFQGKCSKHFFYCHFQCYFLGTIFSYFMSDKCFRNSQLNKNFFPHPITAYYDFFTLSAICSVFCQCTFSLPKCTSNIYYCHTSKPSQWELLHTLVMKMYTSKYQQFQQQKPIGDIRNMSRKCNVV